MLSLTQRISAFVKLSERIQYFLTLHRTENDTEAKAFFSMLDDTFYKNQWFTTENSRFALAAISDWLRLQKLNSWTSTYSFPELELKPKRIGLIMAGNIPLVGFHDILCVLISGHIAVLKMSKLDQTLLQWIVKELVQIEPKFNDCIQVEEHIMKDIDAVIATGSDNSSRYFDYYFSKYPNIIRKHRNSVAVISGQETREELALLAKDIFQYYGLGCRNVSKLMVPKSYDFKVFFESIEVFSKTMEHTKYINNYEYNKAIFLINKVEHLDNGFLLLTKNPSMHSPVGVLYYEEYENLSQVNEVLKVEQEKIQCIVSQSSKIEHAISIGDAQEPTLLEYADNVDTMEFLKSLNLN